VNLFLIINTLNLIMDISNQKNNTTAVLQPNAKLNKEQNQIYTERFFALTKLIRVSKMISNAKIIRSPKMPKA
jgi:hypothetical protein